MRVELFHPDSDTEPRHWVRHDQAFAMMLRPGSIEWGSKLASFRALRVICCAPPHHLNTPLRHPSAPFNLHRARVRRNRGRLPSSRCIESAQTRHARAPTLLHRASDTTLGLLRTNPAVERGSVL